MQVPDGLTAVFVAIDHNAKPFPGETQIDGRRSCRPVDGIQEAAVLFRKVHDGGNVPAGDNEEVVGRLGRNVADNYHVVVLVEEFGGGLPSADTAEDAVLVHGQCSTTRGKACEGRGRSLRERSLAEPSVCGRRVRWSGRASPGRLWRPVPALPGHPSSCPWR